MRRLEQVTALVVAAGLAIVSYWLFFSWAGGGGYSRQKQRSSMEVTAPSGAVGAGIQASEQADG